MPKGPLPVFNLPLDRFQFFCYDNVMDLDWGPCNVGTYKNASVVVLSTPVCCYGDRKYGLPKCPHFWKCKESASEVFNAWKRRVAEMQRRKGMPAVSRGAGVLPRQRNKRSAGK